MNPINNQAVDELEKRFEEEWELLIGCSSKLGTFERVAMRTIPLLRDHPLTKELINQWDTSNNDLTLLIRAYTELDNACQQIRNEKNAHPNWVEGAKQILEEVKKAGSCSNITDRDCEGLHIDASGQKSTIKIEKADPPCHRIYYKLKSLYVSAISKTWEITFAPSAYRIIQESSQGELALKMEADPRYIWKQLVLFEECWAIRNDILCINWSEAQGNGVTMWLDADKKFRKALRARLASDFSFASVYGPNRKTEFFQREFLEKWVNRLFKEILLILRHAVVGNLMVPSLFPKINEGEEEHWRTKQEREDQENLYPIAEQVWKKVVQEGHDPQLFSQRAVAKNIKKLADSQRVFLHSNALSRYLKAAKLTDPRIYKNGKCMGLKPGY